MQFTNHSLVASVRPFFLFDSTSASTWQRRIWHSTLGVLLSSVTFCTSPVLSQEPTADTPEVVATNGEAGNGRYEKRDDADKQKDAPTAENTNGSVKNAKTQANVPDAFNQLQTPQPNVQGDKRAGKLHEGSIRNLMRSLGCDSRDVQDMIIAHIAADMNESEEMRTTQLRLLQAMRTKGLPDAQLSVLLDDCRDAFEADKTRRTVAQTQLKGKIGYALTPRIESLLLLLGLEGDVVITLPNPTLLTQLQRERQQLLKAIDGLKIEVNSLRKERDDARIERDACQRVAFAPVLPGNSAPLPGNAIPPAALGGTYLGSAYSNNGINPNGTYVTSSASRPAKSAQPSVESENERLKKENDTLKHELEGLRRAIEENDAQKNDDNK